MLCMETWSRSTETMRNHRFKKLNSTLKEFHTPPTWGARCSLHPYNAWPAPASAGTDVATSLQHRLPQGPADEVSETAVSARCSRLRPSASTNPTPTIQSVITIRAPMPSLDTFRLTLGDRSYEEHTLRGVSNTLLKPTMMLQQHVLAIAGSAAKKDRHDAESFDNMEKYTHC